MKFLRKKVIKGCREHGTEDSPLLTRLVLFGCRYGEICLHIFHRSDSQVYHNHPWNFVSIVLWNGYIEQTADGRKRRKFPGMILFRRANWTHRVELVRKWRSVPEGWQIYYKRAVTLVIKGPEIQEWGFETLDGFQSSKEYFAQNGCTEPAEEKRIFPI